MADTETLRADDRLMRTDPKPSVPPVPVGDKTEATLALEAIDEWFGEKLKHLAETHHLAKIANPGGANMKEPAEGYALARQTRDDMRKIVGG